MTAFTLFHTVLSVLPVGFGLVAFARYGAIDPKTRLGKLYVGTMAAASFTGLGFLATLGFTPGQVLGLFSLGLVVVGTLTLRGRWRSAGYAQALALSASYFMLMVFATTETLKRFPTDQPFATSANDSSLLPVRLALLVMFVVGVSYQMFQIRAANRPAARLERVLAQYRHAA
ncbi:MAG TPA: hypothetical protein VGE74_04830 [Gemmata sp.]